MSNLEKADKMTSGDDLDKMTSKEKSNNNTSWKQSDKTDYYYSDVILHLGKLTI